MTRCALLLCLLFGFSCSKKSEEIASPLVGRWTLVAQRDSTGAWTNFIPFVPVQFEFRADGTFDYVDAAGKPKRECCQPTRYALAKPRPVTSSASVFSTITFTDWVSCPTVYCAFSPREWYVLAASEQVLDLFQGKNASGANPVALRYQRVR